MLKNNNLLKNSVILYQFYDKNLSNLLKRKKQKSIKQKLINKFIKIHNLKYPKIENNLINAKNEKWYFSVSHTLGKTYVHFAKQPIGIDCQTIINLNKIKNTMHFLQNKKLFKTYNERSFLILWTAQEAFLKCFYNIYHKNPNLVNWKIKFFKQYIKYFTNKNIFICKTKHYKNYLYTICYKKNN